LQEPEVMQFHHVNGDDKLFAIGSGWRRVGLARLIEEMDKCVVVCANDHLRIHAGTVEIPQECLP
jgi:hypothetical protein